MTACVNKKHTRRVALAVSASLVGALSLGAAAPVAFAEGVDTQFAEDTEFTNGTVSDPQFMTFNGTEWVKVASQYIGEDKDGVTTVDANQLPIRPNIEGVTLAGGAKTEEVTSENVSNYKVRLYRADENGEPTGTPLSGSKAVDAGEYVLTVTALTGSAFEGQTFKMSFIVLGEDLPEVTAYEGDEINDETFIYTGSPLEVSFKYDVDKTLVEGVDYTVSYKVGNKDVEGVEGVGTYTATLTGLGMYAGSTAQAKVVVNPFLVNQDDVTVVIDPFTKDSIPTHPTRVYYEDSDGFTTDLDPTLVGIAVDKGTVNSASATPYTFNVTVSNSVLAEGNVTWTPGTSKTAEGYMVDALVDFQYDKTPLQDHYEIDASAGEVFDVDDITASYGKRGVAVNVTNTTRLSGAAVSGATDDLAASVPGEYQVTVEVDVDTDGTTVYGGSKTFTVKVWKGVVNVDEDLYVYCPDRTDAITSYAKAYDGEELSAGSFDVYGTTTTGVKLTPEDITKKLVDAEGNEVKSATAAGDYKFVVESELYKLQNGTTELPISIAKVDLTTLQIGKLVKWNGIAGQEYLPNGQDYEVSFVDNAIRNLALKFDTGNAAATPDDDDDFAGLDLLPGNVDVDVEYNDNGTWKPVGTIEEGATGQYRVTVSVASDIAANFVLPEGQNSVTVEFGVDHNGYFSDVQPGSWYYGSVNKAYEKGYVKGISGTDFFAPERDITRADATVIIARMAGWDDVLGSMSEGEYKELVGTYVDAFGDVDESAYYARAVAWAAKAGVVHGNNGSFRPDDPITREEFAAMLSNYAALIGEDVSVDADEALADAAGADTVSGWARDAVAWAYENNIMGNNGQSLDGRGNITRAMTAAMCVNYQPEKLPDRPGSTEQ